MGWLPRSRVCLLQQAGRSRELPVGCSVQHAPAAGPDAMLLCCLHSSLPLSLSPAPQVRPRRVKATWSATSSKCMKRPRTHDSSPHRAPSVAARQPVRQPRQNTPAACGGSAAAAASSSTNWHGTASPCSTNSSTFSSAANRPVTVMWSFVSVCVCVCGGGGGGSACLCGLHCIPALPVPVCGGTLVTGKGGGCQANPALLRWGRKQRRLLV